MENKETKNDNKKQSPVVLICIGICLVAAVGAIIYGIISPDTEQYITTDILEAKNVQLDKNTFSRPNNEEDYFYVTLVKRGVFEIDFGTMGNANDYQRVVNQANNPEFNKIPNQNVTPYTIAGIDGYLDTSFGSFMFVFEKDGKYYFISDVDGTHEWNKFIEEDIEKLLIAWSEKN